jgi:diguanylate cyclase (GGDEF)-like protein
LINLAYAVATLFLIFFAVRFYKREQTDLAIVLTITIVLQIIASFIGYLIDTQQSSMVYVGGIPMTLLSLVVLATIIRGFKQQSTRLYEQLIEKESLHNFFSKLVVISNEEGQDSFYHESIALLSEYSKADYVLFGLIDDNNTQEIKTKVAFCNNQLIDNFAYMREGSPCENVMSFHACVYKSDVATDFPKDVMLKDEKIEAYVGYPIIGLDKKAIGVLVLLYKTPLTSDKPLQTVTDVIATRLSAELRREALQNELKASAYTDYLTQLPNRIKLLHFINKTKNDVIAEDNQALLLLIDLDHFGEINRKFGYEVGDRVVKTIGGRLSNYASDGIFIARCSGDEFAVVITKVQADISQLANVHWTAIKAIINQTCLIGSRKINVGCSMGAIAFSSQLNSNLDIVGCAEHAIMQAKEQGRNKYTFFNPSLLSEMEHAREIEFDLIDALAGSDGLDIHYQPKVDRSGKVIGAEALLRWFSKKRGTVSPLEFIPIAEGSGVIHALGQWVLKRVFSDIREWKKNNILLSPISINVTASQFEDDEFIESLIAQVKEFEIESNLIELELTESGLLSDKSKAIDTLTKVRDSGISIALDDFGTGYSSLSYLSELPLDVLKIDKSFVDGLDNARNRELVKAIIAISESLDLTNIAEGTETIEQVDLLTSYGCKYFQGYYFSKPLNKIEFERLLLDGSKIS